MLSLRRRSTDGPVIWGSFASQLSFMTWTLLTPVAQGYQDLARVRNAQNIIMPMFLQSFLNETWATCGRLLVQLADRILPLEKKSSISR